MFSVFFMGNTDLISASLEKYLFRMYNYIGGL